MDVKFYYTTKNALQMSFDNRSFVVSIVDSDVHIVYQEVNMCGATREKGKLGAGRNAVTASKRPTGAKMCQKCEELYKANGHSEWHRWVKNVSA